MRDGQRALEFVRFFSALSTFTLLRPYGCVELTDDPHLRHLMVVDSAQFKRRLRRAMVEMSGSAERRNLGFLTTRAVVCADQSVYELTEQVAPDGMYFVISKKLLLKSARALGVTLWLDR